MRYILALTAMLVGWSPLPLAVELLPLDIRPLSVQFSVTHLVAPKNLPSPEHPLHPFRVRSQRRMNSVEVSKLQFRTFANRGDEVAEAMNE